VWKGAYSSELTSQMPRSTSFSAHRLAGQRCAAINLLMMVELFNEIVEFGLLV
jgi:hypothetical protein